jgi:hypothetical protein
MNIRGVFLFERWIMLKVFLGGMGTGGVVLLALFFLMPDVSYCGHVLF